MDVNLNLVDPLIKLLGESGRWLAEVSFGSVLVRMALAFVCAGILGIERTTKKQVAGLRTYILVCLGSCVAMFMNQFIFEMVGEGDIARIANGVVGGLGFLGAGSIMMVNRGRVRGLTTASGLWAAGCIGLSIGIGFYTLAIAGTFFVSIILMFMPFFENMFVKRARYFDLHIEMDGKEHLREMLAAIREGNYRISTLTRDAAYEGSNLCCYSLTVHYTGPRGGIARCHKELIAKLSELPYVIHAADNA